MSCDGEYMLREQWRRSEVERDRLEREMEAVQRLDGRVDELTAAVRDLKRRLAEYDAMCLSARMHDQVFLTAGEVKGLSEAVDIRVGRLERRVAVLEAHFSDDGR